MHIQFVAHKFQTEHDGMGQRTFHIGNNGRDKFVTDTVFEVRLEILVVKTFSRYLLARIVLIRGNRDLHIR
jgi:hypothetical protein